MDRLPAFPPLREERGFSRPVLIASYVLMAAVLLLSLTAHLLIGLLAVCVGFLSARWISRSCREWSKTCSSLGFLPMASARASLAARSACLPLGDNPPLGRNR